MKTGKGSPLRMPITADLLNESTIDLNGPARLSRKRIGQSPWRTTQAGKRQVKNQAQSNLVVICMICGPETLEPLNPEPLNLKPLYCGVTQM